MDREDKIRFLSHRLKGRTTQSHLESKSDQYINALFIIEGNVFVNESKKKADYDRRRSQQVTKMHLLNFNMKARTLQ